jgi:hypothetical protein
VENVQNFLAAAIVERLAILEWILRTALHAVRQANVRTIFRFFLLNVGV